MSGKKNTRCRTTTTPNLCYNKEEVIVVIPEQTVKVKITKRNIEHYKSKGYDVSLKLDKRGDTITELIEVDVFDLTDGSHAVIQVVCDICGKSHENTYKQAIRGGKNVCSKVCLSVLQEQNALTKIEQKINMPLKKFLEIRYLEEMKTTRQIAKEVFGRDTSATTIKYWLDKFDIPVRHGSEAIKTQWLDADHRREQNRKLAKEKLNTKENRQKLIGIMQTDEYKEKARNAKLGDKNPMFGVIGESHPNWNPELSEEDRIRERKTFEDTQWRLEVYRRDKFKCQKCGCNKKLNAHHILNHKTHKYLRHDVDNGVTLCESCHINFHKTYGYFNNTRDQINEYLILEVAH